MLHVLMTHQGNAKQNHKEVPLHRHHRMLVSMSNFQGPCTLLLGVQNDSTTLEIGLAVSYKVKYPPTV